MMRPTGPRGCNDCTAPPNSFHADSCDVVIDGDPIRCPHGTVESDTVKCRDCQVERARA